MANNKDFIKKEIDSKLNVARISLKRLKMKKRIKNFFVIGVVTISSVITLGMILSHSQDGVVTEIHVYGSQTSLTVYHISFIMLVVSLLTISFSNNQSLLKDINALKKFITAAKKYLDNNYSKEYQKDFDYKYNDILLIIEESDHYSYNLDYLHKDSIHIKIHMKRMVARKFYIYIGIV